MGRRLALYAAGAVSVRLADEGARVGLTLLGLQRSGSAAVGGALVAALLVPHVVAAPVVGLLADRARRLRLLVAAAALLFGSALAATAAGLLGRVPLSVVLVVLVTGGCCGPALTGALTSQLPGLVSRERLSRAFGLDSLTYNGAGIAGPAAVAGLAGATSPAGAAYALAASAGLGAALIAVLPVREQPTTTAPRSSDLLAGAKALLHDRVLTAVTGATSVGQLGMGALPVIAALLAHHHHSDAAAGWLLTAVAAGGLLGSLAWTWRPAASEHAGTVVMAGLIGVGIPLAVAAFLSSLPVTAAHFAFSGFCNGPLFGAVLVTRQDHAPAELRSQVSTLGAGAKITATAAGAALAGLAVGHASAGVLLGLAAVCPVLAGGFGQLFLRRSR